MFCPLTVQYAFWDLLMDFFGRNVPLWGRTEITSGSLRDDPENYPDRVNLFNQLVEGYRPLYEDPKRSIEPLLNPAFQHFDNFHRRFAGEDRSAEFLIDLFFVLEVGFAGAMNLDRHRVGPIREKFTRLPGDLRVSIFGTRIQQSGDVTVAFRQSSALVYAKLAERKLTPQYLVSYVGDPESDEVEIDYGEILGDVENSLREVVRERRPRMEQLTRASQVVFMDQGRVKLLFAIDKEQRSQ